MTKEYLTRKQVSEFLPTHPAPQSVYNWMKYGCRGVFLQGFHLGKELVTTKEALDVFADELAKSWGNGKIKKARKIKK